jgi:hypothetical protein
MGRTEGYEDKRKRIASVSASSVMLENIDTAA